MIISDNGLLQMLADGSLGVSPMTPEQIQPASIDLRLGFEFLVPDNKTKIIDIRKQPDGTARTVDAKQGFIINPGEFVLATTMETIKIPDTHTAWLEGRSSIGRRGLFIHNAGWIDPGFEGEITLELLNANSRPLRVYPEIRVAQLILCELETACKNPYRGKYQNQSGVVQSRLYQDPEIINQETKQPDDYAVFASKFLSQIKQTVEKRGADHIDLIIEDNTVYGTYHSRHDSFPISDTLRDISSEHMQWIKQDIEILGCGICE